MKSFNSYTKQVFLSTLYALMLVSVMWFILPFKLFIQGILLGMVFSLIIGNVTRVKTKQISEAAVDQTKRKVRGSGMMTRMLLVIFAIYLTTKYPDYFSAGGAILGLLSVTIISFGYTLTALLWKKFDI